MSEKKYGPNTAEWRDDPANAWCKVCDRGLEGCTHESGDPS